MADSRVFPEPPVRSSGMAGTISKINLENFMCHSKVEILFGDRVNFITGQNGSGKSAILTALCVAFGCRAKSTQRAATLKDFIKTGCGHAVVRVELNNQREDAFKPEVYGDFITIERRISETSGSIALKDHNGKKVAGRREDVRELVEHFNIDVENPCVIMTQDKSREFLHSGNSKDKFKFFFKATLLQQVEDLLQRIGEVLESANAMVVELEKSIEPKLREINDLRIKIANWEQVEKIQDQAEQLRKALAWSWVYDIDKQLQVQIAKVEKLQSKVPEYNARVEKHRKILEELKESYDKKKAESLMLVEKTSDIERIKDDLHQKLKSAAMEKLNLEGECRRTMYDIEKKGRQLKTLQDQVNEIQEQHMKDTQAEACEMEKILKELQDQINAAELVLSRLKEEENSVLKDLSEAENAVKRIAEEVGGYKKMSDDINRSIRELKQHDENKVTAFGGDKVLCLFAEVDRLHRSFKRPPIGPIGSHVQNLTSGDAWSFAVENAIGWLLNAFIVTDHQDSMLLRKCANDANYRNLRIFIYDFSKPRLSIPDHMLPQTDHPNVLSAICSDNHTVMNVLVDLGSAERQVLVNDYDAGKKVTFGQRVQNLKEVYTIDGYKMFSRGSVQTILPPNKRARTDRLCSSYRNEFKELESEESCLQEQIKQAGLRKRVAEGDIKNLRGNLEPVKRRRIDAEKDCEKKKLALKDKRKSLAAEAGSVSSSSVDELRQDISRFEGVVEEKQKMLETYREQLRGAEGRHNNLKESFTSLCESAKEEVKALQNVTDGLDALRRQVSAAEKMKTELEDFLSGKLLPVVTEGEEKCRELEKLRQVNFEKASRICPESEVEDLESCKESSPEQLSALFTRINQRLQRETQNFSDSIDDLRMLFEKKQIKIRRKQQIIEDFQQKLKACDDALSLREEKFQRNATLLKRHLTWQFNGHLRKKGISGTIGVSYKEKTLTIEVKMPQDASSTAVRDTRGLSGGERSFSTLCFALALHQMTEAPFRAMDEFDVFMDSISRKISLDTLVDFALLQGSQWIFITPHDISMVKKDDRVKKQEMAAPRS